MKGSLIKASRTLLVAIALPTTLAAQQPDVVAIADRVFSPLNSTHAPGCAVGVARGGKVLLERGYGMANLDYGIPITGETVLESGSVAKQFAAAAIALLATDGKLSLDDPARKYVPELPEYGRVMTIRHLVTHTSGLRDWSNLADWQGWPRGTRAYSQGDAVEMITKQKAINYPVGDFYSYTNSGFVLLRTIVERVSGQPFERFTEERIFRPLGMTHSQWRDDYTRVVPRLAQAYSRRSDGWHVDMPGDNVIAHAGLRTTVGDWLRWNDALTDKTLGAAFTDSMTRRMRLTNGLEIQYALGLFVQEYRGVPQIAHSGSTAGYSTYLARYPGRENLSIAVMCNAAGTNATAYTHALADALLPGLAPLPVRDTVTASPGELARYAGFYKSLRTNTPLELGLSQGQLRVAGGGVLRKLRDGTFEMGGDVVRFETGADGAPRSLRQPTADGDTVVYAFVTGKAWTPTPEQLAVLAGRYRSDEVGTTFEVKVEKGALTLSPRSGVVQTLRPTWADAFSARGYSVWFTRDSKGRVNAMHFGSARAWDFVSQRVP
jgi:CubicO group peptidase (beta-lactamase class C family)